jgi:hypothetical protein
VQIGFAVSLKIGKDLVKPDAMLAETAQLIKRNDIDVFRVGDVVRFSAAKPEPLLELAGPIVDWWQRHGPQPGGRVTLRIIGRYASNIKYSRPEVAVELDQNTIADIVSPFS